MNNYLEHHGILGMKWGKRRYQNPDGTLTPEGKARYGSGTSPIGGSNKPRRAINPRIFDAGKDGKASQAEKGARATKDTVDSTKHIYESAKRMRGQDAATKRQQEIKSMSDDELRKRINRLNMEKQYRQLSDEEVSLGRDNVKEVLGIAGDVLAIGVSAMTIASLIHEAKKG